MQAERWRQIQDLFDAAADLDEPAASAYLASHCPDTALRKEVEALIRNSSVAETFFSSNQPEPAVLEELGELQPGERIGSYEVLRRFGHGGMGSVFLAARADGEFQKQVTVKVIRSGLATPALLRQFRAERQMLARLDHPHIARLLDAGVTAIGLPCVIMEYVDGHPITTWCDERRSPIEQRLLLFRQVCAAVHHAHQHLVVHGDIKPGNIFVTADGVPKLLDFGIGSLLGEAEPGLTRMSTGLMPRLLTPEYASPEQMRGETVTTSSDVYSPGVLLAELLTGSLPFSPEAYQRAKSHPSAELIKPEAPSRIVSRGATTGAGAARAEEAAARRSTSRAKLRSRLRGDLDTIVLTALQEQPVRRYASSERFSDDIHRHLSGRPVAAQPDSWRYRAEKYARRHKVGVAAAVVVALALTMTAVVVRRQQIETLRRLRVVTTVALTDQIDFNDSVQDFPGTLDVRMTMAKRYLGYLKDALKEAPDDVVVQRALAYYNRRLGLIHYGRFRQHLGDSKTAFLYAQKALEGYEQIAAMANRPNGLSDFTQRVIELTQTQGQILHVYSQLGDLQVLTRRDFRAAAQLHQREESAINRMTGGREGVVREADWQMAHLELRRARDDLQMNNLRDALRHAEEAAGRLSRMIARYPPDEDYALYRSYAYLAAAQANLMQRDHANAELKLKLARPELQQAMERQPVWVSPQAYWVTWQLSMASAQAQDGRCGDAIGSAASALELARRLTRLDPRSKFLQEMLAGALYSSAVTLEECGRFAEARAQLTSAVENWDALVRHDPENAEWRYQLDRSRATSKPD